MRVIGDTISGWLSHMDPTVTVLTVLVCVVVLTGITAWENKR